MDTTPRTRLARPAPLAAAALAALTAACTAGGDADRAVACAAPESTAVRTAVVEYIELSSPTPQRFLYAVGTDSVLPEQGIKGLQDKGPSFILPADPAVHGQMRDQLNSTGNWTNFLVAFRGARREGDSAAVVRLAGHYIAGKYDGQHAPPRSMYFACDSTGAWRFTRAEEEKTS